MKVWRQHLHAIMQVKLEDDNDNEFIHVNAVGASGKGTQMATWWLFTRTLNKF
jgi:hypothetical protein